MTLEQLRELAAKVGFPNVDIAAAVAMAESGGDPLAQGDPKGPSAAAPNGVSSSFGLWQVHAPAHPEYDMTELLDAESNARAALAISQGGTDWSPWTTYKSGAYARYMPEGTASV
jgi:hypothetical protein